MTCIIIAGDSGVYSGFVDGGVSALGADGRITLARCRHLRRYYVVGGGDGSAADAAARGVEARSSLTEEVATATLVGVRRAFEASPACVATLY